MIAGQMRASQMKVSQMIVSQMTVGQYSVGKLPDGKWAVCHGWSIIPLRTFQNGLMGLLGPERKVSVTQAFPN